MEGEGSWAGAHHWEVAEVLRGGGAALSGYDDALKFQRRLAYALTATARGFRRLASRMREEAARALGQQPAPPPGLPDSGVWTRTLPGDGFAARARNRFRPVNPGYGRVFDVVELARALAAPPPPMCSVDLGP